uniref:F-box domain-containing protein n=1 Tax=Caenorhabditis tropicalis TaxID=1561998 RepID=A0A1I7ULI0_9PELO
MGPPSLLDMPDTALNIILDHVGFRSIIILRRVCHPLRNYIDHEVPDINLTRLAILLGPTTVRMLCLYDGGLSSVIYTKKDAGYLVSQNHKEVFSKEKGNLLEDSLKNIQFVLKHQKSKLKYFHLAFENMGSQEEYERVISPLLERMKTLLESRPRLLKIKDISFPAFKPDHGLSVLPFIDPRFLETISVSHPYFSLVEDSERIFDVDTIAHLEQWKNVKEFKTFKLNSTGGICKFLHLSTVAISVLSVSVSDLELLKENFLNPTFKMQQFEIIQYGNFDDAESYFETFGEGQLSRYSRPDSREFVWEIEIPPTQSRLKILFNPDKHRIRFSKIID